MNFHPGLNLPDEAIAQIAQAPATVRTDELGVRQLEFPRSPSY